MGGPQAGTRPVAEVSVVNVGAFQDHLVSSSHNPQPPLSSKQHVAIKIPTLLLNTLPSNKDIHSHEPSISPRKKNAMPSSKNFGHHSFSSSSSSSSGMRSQASPPTSPRAIHHQEASPHSSSFESPRHSARPPIDPTALIASIYGRNENIPQQPAPPASQNHGYDPRRRMRARDVAKQVEEISRIESDIDRRLRISEEMAPSGPPSSSIPQQQHSSSIDSQAFINASLVVSSLGHRRSSVDSPPKPHPQQPQEELPEEKHRIHHPGPHHSTRPYPSIDLETKGVSLKSPRPAEHSEQIAHLQKQYYTSTGLSEFVRLYGQQQPQQPQQQQDEIISSSSSSNRPLISPPVSTAPSIPSASRLLTLDDRNRNSQLQFSSSKFGDQLVERVDVRPKQEHVFKPAAAAGFYSQNMSGNTKRGVALSEEMAILAAEQLASMRSESDKQSPSSKHFHRASPTKLNASSSPPTGGLNQYLANLHLMWDHTTGSLINGNDREGQSEQPQAANNSSNSDEPIPLTPALPGMSTSFLRSASRSQGGAAASPPRVPSSSLSIVQVELAPTSPPASGSRPPLSPRFPVDFSSQQNPSKPAKQPKKPASAPSHHSSSKDFKHSISSPGDISAWDLPDHSSSGTRSAAGDWLQKATWQSKKGTKNNTSPSRAFRRAFPEQEQIVYSTPASHDSATANGLQWELQQQQLLQAEDDLPSRNDGRRSSVLNLDGNGPIGNDDDLIFEDRTETSLIDIRSFSANSSASSMSLIRSRSATKSASSHRQNDGHNRDNLSNNSKDHDGPSSSSSSRRLYSAGATRQTGKAEFFYPGMAPNSINVSSSSTSSSVSHSHNNANNRPQTADLSKLSISSVRNSIPQSQPEASVLSSSAAADSQQQDSSSNNTFLARSSTFARQAVEQLLQISESHDDNNSARGAPMKRPQSSNASSNPMRRNTPRNQADALRRPVTAAPTVPSHTSHHQKTRPAEYDAFDTYDDVDLSQGIVGNQFGHRYGVPTISRVHASAAAGSEAAEKAKLALRDILAESGSVVNVEEDGFDDFDDESIGNGSFMRRSSSRISNSMGSPSKPAPVSASSPPSTSQYLSIPKGPTSPPSPGRQQQQQQQPDSSPPRQRSPRGSEAAAAAVVVQPIPPPSRLHPSSMPKLDLSAVRSDMDQQQHEQQTPKVYEPQNQEPVANLVISSISGRVPVSARRPSAILSSSRSHSARTRDSQPAPPAVVSRLQSAAEELKAQRGFSARSARSQVEADFLTREVRRTAFVYDDDPAASHQQHNHQEGGGYITGGDMSMYVTTTSQPPKPVHYKVIDMDGVFGSNSNRRSIKPPPAPHAQRAVPVPVANGPAPLPNTISSRAPIVLSSNNPAAAIHHEIASQPLGYGISDAPPPLPSPPLAPSHQHPHVVDISSDLSRRIIERTPRDMRDSIDGAKKLPSRPFLASPSKSNQQRHPKEDNNSGVSTTQFMLNSLATAASALPSSQSASSSTPRDRPKTFRPKTAGRVSPPKMPLSARNDHHQDHDLPPALINFAALARSSSSAAISSSSSSGSSSRHHQGAAGSSSAAAAAGGMRAIPSHRPLTSRPQKNHSSLSIDGSIAQRKAFDRKPSVSPFIALLPTH